MTVIVCTDCGQRLRPGVAAGPVHRVACARRHRFAALFPDLGRADTG